MLLFGYCSMNVQVIDQHWTNPLRGEKAAVEQGEQPETPLHRCPRLLSPYICNRQCSHPLYKNKIFNDMSKYDRTTRCCCFPVSVLVTNTKHRGVHTRSKLGNSCSVKHINKHVPARHALTVILPSRLPSPSASHASSVLVLGWTFIHKLADKCEVGGEHQTVSLRPMWPPCRWLPRLAPAARVAFKLCPSVALVM